MVLMAKALLLVMVVLPAVLAAPAEESQQDPGKIWAVLVAGSNQFYNYRHQADICHAYQIFHRHGVPDSQIIVMMYDDIANNVENRKKGKIFNKPGGPNVYPGVPKDYTKTQVTPDNFIHVLTGNSSAVEGVGSGKVLKSGPNDHVFVNFADHGAVGIVGFPDGKLLYKNELSDALTTMHEKKMFKKLVFYMEACESGSMFEETLPEDISIFATTAANGHESSYACYFDNTLQTYLGDEYSVAWMEDIDSEEHQANRTSETLLQQFNGVLQRVNSSHPQIFGEVDIEDEPVVDFMGTSKNTTLTTGLYSSSEPAPFKDSVSSRDVPLHILTKKLELTNDIYEYNKILKKRDALVKGRKAVDDLFQKILIRVSLRTGKDLRDLEKSRPKLTMDMMPCYKTLVNSFDHVCVNIGKNSFVFGHLYKLANLCALDHLAPEHVLEIYNQECTEDTRGMNGVD